MKVIKIEGVKEDASIIQKNLETSLIHQPVFIINEDKLLYNFIEELEVDGGLLYKLKIAKEIDFTNINVMLKDKITDNTIVDNITCISDLLEKLEEDKIKSYKLIVETEDNVLISEIMQNLIYLNINLEVMMSKEKKDREIINVFRRHFDSIRAAVIKGEKGIRDLMVTDDFLNERKDVLNTLYTIENDLEKARERELYISVMATKKAGKSVIVNSFLKEQYAPTSFELPTPNTCIYKRSNDENIRLVYGKRDMLFKNAKDIYKYIWNEFKQAQNDREQGYTIDDMEIHYTNFNNSFDSFTIIDTPGSNYALSKDIKNGENFHKKNAYKWIKKSDVVLFLINYSNYLSINEEEFLKDIKSQFEEQDKFYSLVIVVNKLDEMYISECENKSVVRFLDYIRCKLNDLGYKGFVVMGTSARSYFDAIKVSQIDSNTIESIGEAESIENLRGPLLRVRLKALKQQFIGKAEMSALSFVDDQLEKLECFYGLEDYDLNTLRNKSGIPSLIEYTSYIAIRKAYIELYRLRIRSIDEKFIKFRNASIVSNLMDSKKNSLDEIQEIESMLYNLINRFKAIQQGMEDKLSFEQLRVKLLRDIQKSIDKRLEYVCDLCETRIDEFFMKLMLKNSDQLKNIKNKTMDIDLSINNKIFIQELNMIIENFLNTLNSELDKKEKYIQEAEDRMKKVVEGFSEMIRREYDLKNFSITVPKLGQDYKRTLLVKMPILDTANYIFKDKIIESIEVRGNTVGRIFNYIIGNRYESYAINSNQLKRVKEEYIDYIRNNINNEYYVCYDLLKTNLLGCINEYHQQLNESFNNIANVYKNIIADILRDLTDSKVNAEKQLKFVDSKLQFFSEIDKVNKEFIDLWNIVRESSF